MTSIMTHCADATVSQDYYWMGEAIRLARRGQYTTSPNPNVGCIIVDSKQNVVGQGFHVQAGTPHAEVHALAQAGAHARGATAYVTLEPCSHFGRTPPCADALIQAGVAKVVVAMTDPNPQVSGNGIAKLQQAGIEVVTDVMAAEATEINRGFIKRMIHGTPFVTVKLAISLDGKIALANGQSQWITGAAARADVHRHRAKSCAILTGSGTVIKDNPSLLVRTAEANIADYPLSTLRQPLRVVVDSKGEVPFDAQLLNDGQATLLATTETGAGRSKKVASVVFSAQEGRVPLIELMKNLGQRQINHVWVEAGPGLAGALLNVGLVDELIVYQAPVILGDKATSMFTLPELTDLQQAYSLTLKECRRIGTDNKLIFGVKLNVAPEKA